MLGMIKPGNAQVFKGAVILRVDADAHQKLGRRFGPFIQGHIFAAPHIVELGGEGLLQQAQGKRVDCNLKIAVKISHALCEQQVYIGRGLFEGFFDILHRYHRHFLVGEKAFVNAEPPFARYGFKYNFLKWIAIR